jgi:hypothetical protein
MGGLLFDLWCKSGTDWQNFHWMVLCEGFLFHWDLAQGSEQAVKSCA